MIRMNMENRRNNFLGVGKTMKRKEERVEKLVEILRKKISPMKDKIFDVSLRFEEDKLEPIDVLSKIVSIFKEVSEEDGYEVLITPQFINNKNGIVDVLLKNEKSKLFHRFQILISNNEMNKTRIEITIPNSFVFDEDENILKEFLKSIGRKITISFLVSGEKTREMIYSSLRKISEIGVRKGTSYLFVES